MKQGTAALLLGLIIIGVASGLYLAERYRTYQEAEGQRFAIADTGAIVRIDLVEKHGDTLYRRLFLVRKGQSWRVNDTLPALEQTVHNLLKVLRSQVARAPVSASAQRNVLRFLARDRIEVTLTFRDGTQETFYVGGPTPDQRASYMIKLGYDQPYEVFMPGLEGYLTPYYVPNLSAWHEAILLEVRPVDLAKISLAYLGSPDKSWTLERSQPMAAWRLATGEPIDSLQLADYLLHYTGRLLAQDLVLPDSLQGLNPAYELIIQTFEPRQFHLVIYPHPSSPFHYYVRLLHSPYFTYYVERILLDRFLVPREYFGLRRI